MSAHDPFAVVLKPSQTSDSSSDEEDEVVVEKVLKAPVAEERDPFKLVLNSQDDDSSSSDDDSYLEALVTTTVVKSTTTATPTTTTTITTTVKSTPARDYGKGLSCECGFLNKASDLQCQLCGDSPKSRRSLAGFSPESEVLTRKVPGTGKRKKRVMFEEVRANGVRSERQEEREERSGKALRILCKLASLVASTI